MDQNDQDSSPYIKLEALREVCKERQKNQGDIALLLGVSRRMINRWLLGEIVPSQKHWRQKWIVFLLEELGLKRDHQRFHKIWTESMVGGWKWETLSDQEITELNLDPPLALFLNVPARPFDLPAVGREELLVDLQQRLLAKKSFALTGKPGVGKTQLALELARDRAVMTQFADGIVWIKMGPTPDVMGELAKLADGFGIDVTPLTTEVTRTQAVKNAIGRRHVLIVIDDVWELSTEKDSFKVKDVFNFDGPNCCTVLTTRHEGIARGFFLDPDKVVHVPELAYEKAEDPAHKLMWALAPEVCTADPTGVQRLVRTVGGLPLALVLLGGYLAAPERHAFAELSQAALRELEDPQRRLQLAQERLGALDNQEMTLQAIIELSLEELKKYAQMAYHAFYTLGAFAPKPERFARAAAEHVTGVDVMTLGILVARNLVERTDGEWLALHQVLAEVARTKLAPEAMRRHQAYYLQIVNKNREDWQQIEKVYGQVKWAWVALSADEEVLEFIRALSIYQDSRGLWQDRQSWTEQGLQVAQLLGWQEHVGTLLNRLGNIYQDQGRWSEAIVLYEQALGVFRELGDRDSEGMALANLGIVYERQGRWDEAIQQYKHALTIYREEGSQHGEAHALVNLGNVYQSQGRWTEAGILYARALAVQRELGDRYGEAQTLGNLGNIYLRQGQWSDAIALYEQILVIFQQLGNQHAEGIALNNLGNVFKSKGRWSEAIVFYKQALDVFQKLGDSQGEGITLTNLGTVYQRQEQWNEVGMLYAQALAIFQKLGDQEGESAILTNSGNAYQSQGRWSEATALYEKALSVRRELGDRYGEEQILDNLGNMYQRQGLWNEAIALYIRTLAIARELGDRHGQAITLTNLGSVYRRQGEWTEAIALYEQALSIFQELGDSEGEGITLTNLGSIYRSQEESEKAVTFYKGALRKLHPNAPIYEQVSEWLRVLSEDQE